MFIGEERAVGALWDATRNALPAPREDRPGQPVYELREAGAPAGTGIREATLDDLDLLVPACAAAHELELGIDPLKRDPEGFRRRTLAQIGEGRSWIWRVGDTIRFKAEASALTPNAVQLQQVWTDPAARGQGYAKRGLEDLCRLLLETVPVVTLFVRAENEVAIRLYDAVGMRRTMTYRSILF
jgi:predicted GNAT family acetyltransferase